MSTCLSPIEFKALRYTSTLLLSCLMLSCQSLEQAGPTQPQTQDNLRISSRFKELASHKPEAPSAVGPNQQTTPHQSSPQKSPHKLSPFATRSE